MLDNIWCKLLQCDVLITSHNNPCKGPQRFLDEPKETKQTDENTQGVACCGNKY